MSKARTITVIGAAVVLVAGTWIVAGKQQSPKQAAANAKAPADTPVLVPVEQRVLEKPIVFRCSASAQAQTAVAVPTLPDGYLAVVTKIQPGSPFHEIREGTVLIEVSHRPVIALGGAIPAYRALHSGIAGKDVAQLQVALRRRGLRPETNGSFGPRTEAAVERLYRSAGYTPTYLDPGANQHPTIPLGEVVFVPFFPAQLKTLVKSSQRVEGATLAEISSGEILVKGGVPAPDAGGLTNGMAVTVFNDLDGTSSKGVIRSIGRVTSSESGPSREVAVAPSGAPASLLGADLRCASVVARTAATALIVPITAILSGPTGQTYVLVSAGARRQRRVEVTVGLTTATHAEIRPKESGSVSGNDFVVVEDAR